jgi:hypothetical protein
MGGKIKTDKQMLELLDKRKRQVMDTASFIQLNVLEKELRMLKNRKKSESISDDVVDYLKRRIKELNEHNV